jgi:hypothetical protein
MVNIIYPHQEISRIMTAAVVNFHFRQNLLTNPREAIEKGFGEEFFILNQDESDQLASIQADSLEEFAIKIVYT